CRPSRPWPKATWWPTWWQSWPPSTLSLARWTDDGEAGRVVGRGAARGDRGPHQPVSRTAVGGPPPPAPGSRGPGVPGPRGGGGRAGRHDPLGSDRHRLLLLPAPPAAPGPVHPHPLSEPALRARGRGGPGPAPAAEAGDRAG